MRAPADALRSARLALAPRGTRREAVLSRILEWVGLSRDAGPATPPSVTQEARLLTPRVFRVLFVSADAALVSHRYRVLHYRDYLAASGIESAALPLHEVPAALSRVPLHDVVVAFRLAMTPVVQDLYAACRRAGVPIVYDVDDLVFEPETVVPAYVDGLRALSAAGLAEYLERIPRYREALLGADLCTTTTETLAARCRALGLPTIVLPNGLDPHEPTAPHGVSGAEVRLGYFSGTPTHQRDFAVAAPALERILDEFAFVRLRIVGALDLHEFPELARFGVRVETRPFMPWEALRAEVAAVDVSLAPLEVGNPYCEAKSEIKWLEAAAVGVPTVASATAPFSAAIADGETGFLARTEGEWYQALARLVTDPALRRRVGEAARREVDARYAPTRLAAGARAAYVTAIEAARARGPWPPRALAVTFVLRPYAAGTAEPARPLALAIALAERGHEVRLAIDGSGADAERSLAALRDDGFLRTLRFAGPIADLVACDALVATTAAVTLAPYAGYAAAALHLTHDADRRGLGILLADARVPVAIPGENTAAAAFLEDLLRRVVEVA